MTHWLARWVHYCLSYLNNALPQVADVMHSLFTTHRTMLLPFFDKLLSTFSAMLVSVFNDPVTSTGDIICAG